MRLIDFERNCFFGVVLYFRLFGLLGKELMVYGFWDLAGFHSSSTMLRYLEIWWFKCFLSACLILEQTTILVWFNEFNCFIFLFFWVRDGLLRIS